MERGQEFVPDHRRSFVTVNVSAIRDNTSYLKSTLPDGCALGAVVKADGYGHGAAAAAGAAIAGGAAWLMVATVPEGLLLRRDGFREIPMLVLGAIGDAEIEDLVRARLVPTVDAGSPISAIGDAAERHRCAPYPVHIKIDTGLNRFGVPAECAVACVREQARQRNIVVQGISTHFATADSVGDAYLHEQAERFAGIVTVLEREGLRPPIVHASNSGAVLQAVAPWDMVRIGIALYGISPAPDFPLPNAFRSAMSVQSRVARVFDLVPGATVGYGRRFTTQSHCRAALIPLGYADGMPRSLSNHGNVLVGGHRCPIIGAVSMDQCVALIPDDCAVVVDDPVVIVGSQGQETQTMTDLASAAGTIAYELAVRFGARMRREYAQ